MTEKQWLRSTNAEKMNEFYGDRHTERKARLLMLACCRRFPEYLTAEPVKAMLEMLVAHYADPRQPDTPFDGKAIRAAYRKLEAFASPTQGAIRGLAFGMVAAAEPVSKMRRLEEDFEYLVFSCTHDVAVGVTGGKPTREAKHQAVLMREILGNPFRPVAVNPAWLTDTVVSLARAIHEGEDFGTMPILADALQDAGCDHNEVLNHCRDQEQVHVRGCWVLDLILGASVVPTPKPKRKRAPRRPKP